MLQQRRHRNSRSSTPEFTWERPLDSKPGEITRARTFWPLVLLALLGCAVAAIGLVARRNALPSGAQSISPSPIKEIMPPFSPEARSAAALDALLAFANAPDHKSRLPLLYESNLAAATLDEFYSRDPELLPQKVLNPSVSAITLDGREILLVSFLDHRHRPWSAPFEWFRDSYKLHWKAMTSYCETPWSNFLQNHPRGKFIMRGKLYLPEAPISDPGSSDFTIALVSHPDLSQPSTLRIPRGSKAAESIKDFPRSKDVPGIFEVSWDANAAMQATRPILVRWIQRDWIE